MPQVYLLARPLFTESYLQLLRDMLPEREAHWIENQNATPAERLVEFAGRVCYMSFGKLQSPRTNLEYIRNLIRNGHDSVLEHAVWTFALAGVSRAFTHQFVRHRVGFSFSQLSQQYHDETDARFVRPAELNSSPEAAAIWERSIASAHEAYRKIISDMDSIDATLIGREGRRALRSAARSVLPNATESVVVATANARAIRNFLIKRGAILGDSEMRMVSATLLNTLRPEGPALFTDFVIEYTPDGLPMVRHAPLD